MNLNYPQKDNGMYVLRKGQMDEIATMVFKEYASQVLEYPQPVNIDSLAEDCLYLSIKYKYISFDNKVLGLTAFGDVRIPCLDDLFRPTEIDIPEGTIVINSGLLGNKQHSRRRYTTAHEVSHWILHRSYHSPTNQQYQFRTARDRLIACRSASIESDRHELKTDNDWEEWQADTLAAAILMPLNTFQYTASRFIREYAGQSYLTADYRSFGYNQVLDKVADVFKVSKKAAEIRMKQLGFIKSASSVRYYN